MKRILAVAIVAVFLLTASNSPFPASAQQPDIPAGSTVLCAPGVYLTQPGGCIPLGPSQYLTDLARMGITFPIRPLPGKRIDPVLAVLPYYYAALKSGSGEIFGSLEDAMAGASPAGIIEGGNLKFISYIDTAETDGDPKPDFFQLKAGGWMDAADISHRASPYNNFKGGLTFARTPSQMFGWILPFDVSIETKRTPGYLTQDYTGHRINQYEVVTVYSTERVGEMEWYQVAPGEWIEQRMVGRVIPNPKPPEGVTNGRWIEINLYEQTIAVYQDSQLVFASLVASGMEPFWTRPGLFQIMNKLESTKMSGAFELDRSDFYYLEDVPWTMYYDDARALHGAYWRTGFGYQQSHGCVNLSPGDAHWLFDWAEVGDWVYVWDPSGETPTDPAQYSPGGA